MKVIIITLFLCLVLNTSLFPQALDNIDAKIDSLSKLKQYYIDLIEKLTIQIRDLENKKTEILDKESPGVETITLNKAPMYENPEEKSKIIYTISKNTKISVLNYESHYYRVKYKDYIGWVLKNDIAQNEELFEIKQKKLVNKYDIEIAKDILDEKIWLDMTKEMVIDSWGYPLKVSRVVNVWGVIENWQYEDTNLSFKDGKLQRWQDF